jgi:hypothetical protein
MTAVKFLVGIYLVVRWTDRWGTRWENRRGDVRKIKASAPWTASTTRAGYPAACQVSQPVVKATMKRFVGEPFVRKLPDATRAAKGSA